MSGARRRWARLAVACGAALLALLAVELVFRLNRERFGVRGSDLWSLRSWVCHGRGRFEPRAYYGWVFDPDRPETDSSGFIGPEIERARTAGVLRIACLGGSTTAGTLYEGYAGSYPGSLAEVLRARLGRPVEVLNFGVSGWTTAESLVNWVLNAQDYRPDLVVIHHAINDVYPRLAPGFRSDYTHYSHPWRATPYPAWHRFLTRWSDLYAALQLRARPFDLAEHVALPSDTLPTVLDPDTARAYRRNLRTLVENVRWSGATPVLMTMPWHEPVAGDPLERARVAGMQEHNEIARALAREAGCALYDFAASGDPAVRAAFVDLVHLTPQGNRRKAELLADFLLEQGLIPR